MPPTARPTAPPRQLWRPRPAVKESYTLAVALNGTRRQQKAAPPPGKCCDRARNPCPKCANELLSYLRRCHIANTVYAAAGAVLEAARRAVCTAPVHDAAVAAAIGVLRAAAQDARDTDSDSDSECTSEEEAPVGGARSSRCRPHPRARPRPASLVTVPASPRSRAAVLALPSSPHGQDALCQPKYPLSLAHNVAVPSSPRVLRTPALDLCSDRVSPALGCSMHDEVLTLDTTLPSPTTRATAVPLPDSGSEDGTGPPPVHVTVRVRDILYREGTALGVVVNGNHIGVSAGRRRESMVEVDHVLNQQDQAATYDAVGRPLAAAVLRGHNALAIACGPSGSGKTFTVLGDSGDRRGLLPRLLEEVFSSGSVLALGVEVLCCYQERVYDLLHEASIKVTRVQRRIACPPDWAHWPRKEQALLHTRYAAMKRAAALHREAAAAAGPSVKMRTSPLHLREDVELGVAIAVGARRVSVATATEAVRLILGAAKHRPQAPTPANAQSSRGHLLVNLTVQRREGQSSRVQVVDMAGGEHLKLHVHESRRLEGLSINRSLLAVKCTVTAQREGRHVPVRSSVLTRMLTCGKETHTEWISTVAPGLQFAGQTRTTIQEAEAVRGLQRLRLEAAALAAMRAAQEREVRERRAKQEAAAAAAAAATLAASAGAFVQLQDAAERKERAERLTPTVAAAGVAVCMVAQHALWEQAVRAVKAAQRKGGPRWLELYRAALPKTRGKKNLDPARHSLHTLQHVLAAVPAPEDVGENARGEDTPRSGSDGEAEAGAQLTSREKKARKARRQREKAAAALKEEQEEVEEFRRQQVRGGGIAQGADGEAAPEADRREVAVPPVAADEEEWKTVPRGAGGKSRGQGGGAPRGKQGQRQRRR
eukprot:TRINITY_DN61222_c0_g1_i1.p1 TRINITY_DN61222_c0_g1~~TRINITY_DN61222_c0_g1_i1.p1  ORF type:complete len:917 (+),score=195.63 TRINITY_DN61222_c0_g1_i1:109-2751(+)